MLTEQGRILCILKIVGRSSFLTEGVLLLAREVFEVLSGRFGLLRWYGSFPLFIEVV